MLRATLFNKGFQEDYLYDGSGMLIERRVYPLDYGYFPNTGSATVQVLTTSSSISRTRRNVAGMISKASVGVMTGVRLVGAAIGVGVPVLATAAAGMCRLWHSAQPSQSEMADIVDQVSRRSPCPPSVPANYPEQLINFALDKSCRPGNERLCSFFTVEPRDATEVPTTLVDLPRNAATVPMTVCC
jgi:hypothetical protein